MSGSRRRLLQTLISGWSSGSAVTDGVPKLSLFKNPFQSGLQIFELLSRDDTDDDPPSLWSVVTESLGDGLTLSLSDDATLDLGDEEELLRIRTAIRTLRRMQAIQPMPGTLWFWMIIAVTDGG